MKLLRSQVSRDYRASILSGPRQNAALRPLVDASEGDWEDLPADSFKAEGAGVSVALITLHA